MPLIIVSSNDISLTLSEQILAHADSSSEASVGKGSCTIHYPDSLSLTEISIISALLVGTPNLRLGGGEGPQPPNPIEGANCSASMCKSSALGAAKVHTEKDKGTGQEDPTALQTHYLPSCTSSSSSSSAGGKSSMEAFRPHSYFKGVPWGKLLDSPVPASFRPSTVIANEAQTRGDFGLYEDFNFPQTSKSHRDMAQETPKPAVNFTS
jgi:hypothetical protein